MYARFYAVLSILLLVVGCGQSSSGDGVITMGGGPRHTGVYQTTALRQLSGETWRVSVASETTGAPLVTDTPCW